MCQDEFNGDDMYWCLEISPEQEFLKELRTVYFISLNLLNPIQEFDILHQAIVIQYMYSYCYSILRKCDLFYEHAFM